MSILALTSDTLIGTPATGNIEYNGQFFGTDSNASRAQLQRIVQGTAVASTSGTSIDFTSLPAWLKRVTVMFDGVSTNGTSNLLMQIGGGSVETSSYRSTVVGLFNTASVTGSGPTTGFGLSISTSASDLLTGHVVITIISGNTWVCSGNLYKSAGNIWTTAGSKAISNTLDRVRITTVNGTDTFDAGSVNIIYEG